MFAGPIIAREVITAPRPLRFYVARASYVGLLFVGMWTAWQVLIGWRDVTEFGIISRFGTLLFQIFSPLQLTLMLFFAPLAAATAMSTTDSFSPAYRRSRIPDVCWIQSASTCNRSANSAFVTTREGR